MSRLENAPFTAYPRRLAAIPVCPIQESTHARRQTPAMKHTARVRYPILRRSSGALDA